MSLSLARAAEIEQRYVSSAERPQRNLPQRPSSCTPGRRTLSLIRPIAVAVVMIVNAHFVKELISNIREGVHKEEDEESPQKPQLWGYLLHLS